MFGQAYRLIRATAAVVRGVTTQVCKVLPEDSVLVMEEASEDGKIVNVRCGKEKLWMFARDVVDRCRGLLQAEKPVIPANRKLIDAPPEEKVALVGAGFLRDDI
jgi:hypothetical protein